MDKIDISKLTRNDKKIKSMLKQKDNFITIDNDAYVLFPERYEKKELAILANTCQVLGIVALVVGNNYALMKIPNLLEMTPDEIEQVEINEDVYYKFTFNKGDILINNVNVVQKSDKAYAFFELFILQGKIPWYVEYKDIVTIFSNLEKYTGLKAVKNTLVIETLAGVITKVKDNLELDYRLAIKKDSDLLKIQPEYVGLMDVYYSFKSTTNKLLGNFFSKAINSSVLYPEKEISDLEKMLRE